MPPQRAQKEALVRGPAGEGALSVAVTEQNRHRFDHACRVKAIKTAAQLGMTERLSINFRLITSSSR